MRRYFYKDPDDVAYTPCTAAIKEVTRTARREAIEACIAIVTKGKIAPKAAEQMRELMENPAADLCATTKASAFKEVQQFIEENQLACASVYDFAAERIAEICQA